MYGLRAHQLTSNGLLFIGATTYDRKFRAYDKRNGRLLWETTLPASGNATPSLYMVDGRQYVVIAAGGGKNGAPSGGSVVAFALRIVHVLCVSRVARMRWARVVPRVMPTMVPRA